MRPVERIAVFGGILVAIVIALGAGAPGSSAVAGSPQADPLKVGTVDVYQIIEKIMGDDVNKKKREDAAAVWQQKAGALEKELRQLEDTFKVLPPNDPQVQELQKQAQTKQAEYQRLAQDRQQDMEKLNSTQLIEAYGRIREATVAVADRMGYTHILVNRRFESRIETSTVTSTVQEFLARPIIKGIASDDITATVMTEMKLAP
jgi:Skp family chaperone for outer membrane proteins